MIEITVIDVESKELHKMEETKETKEKKTETVNNKNSGHFRNMSTDHKVQKESYASRSVDILFLFCFCSQNVSCGIGLLVCCICTRKDKVHEAP